jgi:4-hydroxy-4-methyl-2-oxoglutarate aldolase
MSTGQIFRSIPRCDDSVLLSLEGFGVADLQDAMDPQWRQPSLMNAEMRPVNPGVRILGRAVTAFNAPGDNLMMHCGLSVAQSGDVLVVSNGGVPHGALWGENAALFATRRGLAGVIVDGPIRDTDALRRLRFPVWSTLVSVSTPGKAKLGSVNVPLTCAGVLVRPGDIVVADGDGVIVLRPELVGPIVERATTRAQKDAAMQAAVSAGTSIFEHAGMDGILRELGTDIEDGTWNGATGGTT